MIVMNLAILKCLKVTNKIKNTIILDTILIILVIMRHLRGIYMNLQRQLHSI
jgi:hypothetical protein